jgi:hypothetical protein
MHDGLVDRRAGVAEGRELALLPVALEHIGRRDGLAANEVGDGTLDDRPMDATGLGAFLLDILEAAIDD